MDVLLAAESGEAVLFDVVCAECPGKTVVLSVVLLTPACFAEVVAVLPKGALPWLVNIETDEVVALSPMFVPLVAEEILPVVFSGPVLPACKVVVSFDNGMPVKLKLVEEAKCREVS